MVICCAFVVSVDVQSKEMSETTKKKEKKKKPKASDKGERDLSSVQCYKCKDFGHFAGQCVNGRPQTEGMQADNEAAVLPKESRDQAVKKPKKAKREGAAQPVERDQEAVGVEAEQKTDVKNDTGNIAKKSKKAKRESTEDAEPGQKRTKTAAKENKDAKEADPGASAPTKPLKRKQLRKLKEQQAEEAAAEVRWNVPRRSKLAQEVVMEFEFQCEFCGKIFATEKKAEKCEKRCKTLSDKGSRESS